MWKTETKTSFQFTQWLWINFLFDGIKMHGIVQGSSVDSPVLCPPVLCPPVLSPVPLFRMDPFFFPPLWPFFEVVFFLHSHRFISTKVLYPADREETFLPHISRFVATSKVDQPPSKDRFFQNVVLLYYTLRLISTAVQYLAGKQPFYHIFSDSRFLSGSTGIHVVLSK